jgi:RNA polymerase sigma factor (sigma-70 family)
MVMSVSRRILNHMEDAEDVFQATFLVLARKAAAVRRRETVGSWLYRVAYRASLDAKAMRERCRARERQVEILPDTESPPVDCHDWRPILDEELCGLPDKYQAPLVLCDLEARSRKDAAAELGIPEGTLSSRLAKARRILAVRLARRGVTLAAGTLAALLAQEAWSVPIAVPLVAETAHTATLVLTGRLIRLSTPVALLMKGVLKAMFIARFKMVGVILMVVCLALGAGVVAYHPADAQESAPAGKPHNELEALRRENALLKLNLEVVLEKVRAQNAELQALKRDLAITLQPREAPPPSQPRESPPLLDISIEDFLTKLRTANSDHARAAYAEAVGTRLLRMSQNLRTKISPQKE